MLNILQRDIFKISNIHSVRWISIHKKPPTPPPPPPKVAPPHHPKVTSIYNVATGNLCNIITRHAKAPPPPSPYVASPHIQTNAYHKWNSIFETKGRTPADPSHSFPQAEPKHQGEEPMSSNYVTTGCPHGGITMRPESLALPV